jgi:T5SS/PEP-CTERM-associated repeat protein
MLRELFGCALALALWLTVAAVGQGAITQEGGVSITPSLVQVGVSAQSQPAGPTGDGRLWITSPSALASTTLNIGSLPSTLTASGAVYVQGGTSTHTEGVYVGRGGHGRLEITEGGVVTGSFVRIGGDLTTTPNSPQGVAIVDGIGSRLRYNDLSVGASSDGQLFITGGAAAMSQTTTSTSLATIGRNSGSTGLAVVDGQGSLWQHGGDIQVGNGGPGTMRITSGGVVISNGGRVGGEAQSSFGSVVIDGVGSRWTTNAQLTLAGQSDSSFGEIVVSNGALLEQGSSNIRAMIGTRGYGRVVVNGAASRWIHPGTPQLGGSNGTGEVFLENGTQFTSAGVDMAQGGGRFVVSGPTTRWTSTGPVIMGKSQINQATLELLDGATLNMALGTAIDIGTNGRLILSNGRLLSTTPRGSTFINAGVVQGGGVIQANGFMNNGRVLVGPGQRLQIAGPLSHSPTGVIEVNDGELEVGSFSGIGGSRVLASGATLRSTSPQAPWTSKGAVMFVDGRNRVFGMYANSGPTTVANGAEAEFYDQVINTGTLSVAAGGKLTMFGALRQNGVGGAGDVFLEGPVQPGSAIGTMSFGGDVYLGGASSLAIEINPNTSAQWFDQLRVDGDLSLSGALQLTALSGLTGPSVMAPIARAGELSGVFSSTPAIGATIGAGVRFHGVTYDYGNDEVLVSLTQGLEGDLDLDGQLSGSDLLAWQRASGSACEAGTGADANCDGVVDGADLAVWRSAVAAAAASQGAVQAAVPEPASWGLAVLGIVGIGAGSRRRRTRGCF